MPTVPLKFEDWFNELECFALRSERFFDEFRKLDPYIIKWLEASFDAGFEAGKKSK